MPLTLDKARSDYIDAMMIRLENGSPHQNDAVVLFYALKHAAQKHTDKKDILKFLQFHINVAIEATNAQAREDH